MILRLRLLALLTDFLLLIVAFILAYFLRVGWIFSTDFEFFPYLVVVIPTCVVWIVFLLIFRVYRLQEGWFSAEHYLRIFLGSIAGIAVFGFLFYLFYRLQFSRLLLVYGYVLATVFLTVSHLGFQALQRHFVAHGKGIIRVLILGSNRAADQLIDLLLRESSEHVPVAILDGYGAHVKELHGVPVLGKLDKLESTVQTYRIDEIIQVDNLEQTINIINFCSQKGLSYTMLPSLLGVYSHHSRELLGGLSVLRVRSRGLTLPERLLGL